MVFFAKYSKKRRRGGENGKEGKYERGSEFLRIPFAERTGLEPVASGVTDQRSNQLSYRSKAVFEWAIPDSNQ